MPDKYNPFFGHPHQVRASFKMYESDADGRIRPSEARMLDPDGQRFERSDLTLSKRTP